VFDGAVVVVFIGEEVVPGADVVPGVDVVPGADVVPGVLVVGDEVVVGSAVVGAGVAVAVVVCAPAYVIAKMATITNKKIFAFIVLCTCVLFVFCLSEKYELTSLNLCENPCVTDDVFCTSLGEIEIKITCQSRSLTWNFYILIVNDAIQRLHDLV
jgi:hypothetical protein